MQTHASVTPSWPRLIGLASGIFGLALASAFAAQLPMLHSPGELHTSINLVPTTCGCVFLFLAFPLFTGREWARKALLVAIYFTLAALAISFSLMVVQRSTSTSHAALRILIGACALVAVLIPPGFILAVLHHPDIRRAYRTNEPYNESIE